MAILEAAARVGSMRMMGRRDRILSLITVTALVVLPGALFVYYEHERRNTETAPPLATAPAPTTTRAPATTVRGFVTPTTPTNLTTTAPTTTTRATTTTARKGADLVGLAEPERRTTTTTRRPSTTTTISAEASFRLLMARHPVIGEYPAEFHYELAAAVCEFLDSGMTYEAEALEVWDAWDLDTFGYFMAGAIHAFCPEYWYLFE